MPDMPLMCGVRAKGVRVIKVRRQKLEGRSEAVEARRQATGSLNSSPFAFYRLPFTLSPWRWVVPAIAGLLLVSCNRPVEPPIDLKLFQQWQFQPGDMIAGRRLLGGLGDLSIELKGKPIYAPFTGKVQPTTKAGCVVFSSSELPAYSFRLCGLDQPKTGPLQKGEEIGSGAILQFAALRKQPNGKWAIVEPSVSMLERTLKPL